MEANKPGDDTPEREGRVYLAMIEQNTRRGANAAMFVAWCISLSLAAMIIMGIVYGIELGHLTTSVSPAQSPACVSQGGTVPGC
jgi:hypothetical protein